MDHGPDVDSGVVWCFVAGEPSVDVIASFGYSLSQGNFQWVVIPIAGLDRFDEPEPAWLAG